MKFPIQHNDSPTVARLKLIYLIPVFIVLAVPLALVVGFMQHTLPGISMIISTIRTGRP